MLTNLDTRTKKTRTAFAVLVFFIQGEIRKVKCCLLPHLVILRISYMVEGRDKSLGARVRRFFNDIAQLIRDTLDAYASVKPDSVEGRMGMQLRDTYKQLQKALAEGIYDAGETFRQAEKNSTGEGGEVKFASRISELTDAGILELIENCNRGEYALRTFIPVRKDTPTILLEKSKQFGLKPLDNRPVIMLVEHVQQCMDDEVAAVDGKRGHALTAQNILDITKSLDTPRYIFYQQDNEKYSLIVEYDTGSRNEKGMAIVDVTRDKNPDQMNGFEGGKYNILVTAYAPDSDYLKKYVKSENNKCIYDKIEDAPQRSSSGLAPSLLNGSSSSPTLTHTEPEVKENDSAKFAAAALEHFGRTFSWKETGYLLKDGAKLDFSGRHEGASGGYRTVDHRDILDIYPEDAEFDGNGAMVDFMRQGNIRIMPEGDGINLQVQPTKAQERALDDFISRARGEVVLDIDDEKGNTVVSVEYPRGTRAAKVLQDIRNYFANGTKPVISELSKLRFSVRQKQNPTVADMLKKEVEKLKGDVEKLKELLKLQRSITGGTKFTASSVEAAARVLKKNAGATGDTAELAGLLNRFYEYIATEQELTWEGVKEQARAAVEWLQSHVKHRRSDYAQEILDQLHGSKIYLDESQKQEAAYRFGSFNAFRQAVMGSITVANEANTSLDSFWQEMSALYPDVFDGEMVAGDMPGALADVIDRLRNEDTSLLEYALRR